MMKTKKKSGKRFLSWLLATVMIITLMPATAFAEPPTESSGNTEPAVTSYCPEPKGGTDVSVGGYDPSPAAETKDTPTAEPAKDTPTAEPAKDTPAAEPVKESPVADKTTEGAPAQKGAVENSTDEKITEDLTNEVSAAELAGLIAMFGAPVLPNTYNIYVYGYFVNGKYNKDKDNILSGENIKIQKDDKAVRTVTWNDSGSFITFGKIENGTTDRPIYFNQKGFIHEKTLKTMLTYSLGDSTDIQNSYFSWKDVAIEDWDLHVAYGATDYSKEVNKHTLSWHMDGKINVYKIKYLDGENGNDISADYVDPDAYYCGTYTIGNAPTAPEGKTFAGWKVSYVVDGKTETLETIYNAPAVATSPNELTLKEFGNAKKITLTAQWKDETTEPEVPKYPVYVYGYFVGKDGNILPKDTPIFKNGKLEQITYNKDKDFITFGSLAKEYTTITDDPANFTAYESSSVPDSKFTTGFDKNTLLANLNKVLLSDSEGNAKTNGIVTESADIRKVIADADWDDLKPREGAMGFDAKGYTWHLDGKIKVHTVVYENGVTDNSVENMPNTNNAHYFNSYLYTINTQEPTRDGYNFLGWKLVGDTSDKLYKASTENKTLTLTDDAVLVAQWQNATETPATYTVNYQWEGEHPNNITLPEPTTTTDPENITASPSTYAPISGKNATGKDGIWKFNGWSAPAKDDVNKTITFTGTWNFTPSETKTITDVLNGLVLKSFTARYNRSTSGTFTATATVVAKSQQEAIPYAAKENVPTVINTNTFTGTVTLSTGQKTEPFVFNSENDPLSPKTEYTITVTEKDSQQSYVTYDKTVYTITFTTGADGKINKEGITISSNNSEATTDPANKTVTFHNIYTYKKHSHSSGDSGNGGGKKEEKPTVEIKDDDALGLNNTDHFAYIVGYGNGEVRPQNSITRAEVASIFFRLLEDDVRDANYTRQNKFTDVSNDAWYCSAVSTLSAMGIISGYPDANFRPNASITRAEFAAIATRFDVNGDKTPASFNDIADHWAKDEIAVAANNGWVNGYEDGSFRPQNKITRAETMSLVNRVLNRKPETAEDLLENMTKWTDNADTNAWYYLAVQEATNSHYYEYKENSQYEKWTELRETRDWSELDK